MILCFDGLIYHRAMTIVAFARAMCNSMNYHLRSRNVTVFKNRCQPSHDLRTRNHPMAIISLVGPLSIASKAGQIRGNQFEILFFEDANVRKCTEDATLLICYRVRRCQYLFGRISASLSLCTKSCNKRLKTAGCSSIGK